MSVLDLNALRCHLVRRSHLSYRAAVWANRVIQSSGLPGGCRTESAMKAWGLAVVCLGGGLLVGVVGVRAVDRAVSSSSTQPEFADRPWQPTAREPFELGAPSPDPGSAGASPSLTPIIALANFTADAAPPQKLTEDDSPKKPESSAVRAVIDRELHDATPEERQIWYDELKALPPGIVEDLLKVKRQFGLAQPRTPAGLKLGISSTTDGSPPRLDLHAPQATWSAASRALRLARDIHLHNLANAHSPGYRRLVPQFSPAEPPNAAEEGAASAWGSRWQGVRLDVRPSEFIATGRPLDVAIHGPGWFIVKTARGSAFTRSGRLVIDAERQLCVSAAQGALPLEPVIAVPAEWDRITINADGVVSHSVKDNDRGVTCGQIQLADLHDPTLLSYQADGLLHLPDDASPQRLTAPGPSGLGPMLPMALEQSNVDAEHEWREVERIDRWLRATTQ
jgi:flagellar basal body rod protein FlgG